MPGFWRSLYGVLGYEYNSINDKPSEKDVKLKQVCMRQISLSKLKLKKIERVEQKTADLVPIRPQLGAVAPTPQLVAAIPGWFKVS